MSFLDCFKSFSRFDTNSGLAQVTPAYDNRLFWLLKSKTETTESESPFFTSGLQNKFIEEAVDGFVNQ